MPAITKKNDVRSIRSRKRIAGRRTNDVSQMKRQITATFEERYVKILVDQDRDFEYSARLWSGVAKACRQYDCYAALLIANTSTALPVMDGIDLGQLLQDSGITGKHRIAWVELNADAFEAIRFLETVLINRYFNARLFASEAEAKRWLADGQDT